MIPRSHRPGLQVLRTRTHTSLLSRLLPRALAASAGLIGAVSIVTIVAAAQALDQPPAADLSAVDQQILLQGMEEAQKARLADAYAAGQADAMQALQHTPQGVQLAQACLAMRAAQTLEARHE